MRVTERRGLGVLGGIGEYVNIRICPPIPKERERHTPKRSEIEDKFRIRIINKIIWGHCATSRKVAGSIPSAVIGFFH